MSKPRMIIDCDPGHDDAVALLLAHRHASIVAVTTVSGNAPLVDTTRNALAVLELIDADTMVVSGAAAPLTGPGRHAAVVHGSDGLGGVTLPPPARAVAGNEAAEFIVDTLHKESGVWLVAIGPLTNVALALRRDPGIAQRVAGIAIMGGSASFGNVTRTAEFNVWADPEAADIVFTSGAPIWMCGLNLTHQLRTTDTLVDLLKSAGTITSTFCAGLFDYLHERMLELNGERSAALHDPCAVLTVTHPQLFEFAPRAVDVELNGTLTRGMTVVDERRSSHRDRANAQVGYRIDSAAAMELIVSAVTSDWT